jgi:hypothetical protein
MLINNSLYSQTTITGLIKSEGGEDFTGISVLLCQASDSAIISYAFSDIDGKYTLSFNNKEERLILSISGLSIVSQTKNIKNLSQTIHFTVNEKAIELKGVVVQAPKIWGAKDTINYLVSAFSAKNDVVIGDVLKKLPGINVSENGQISYQGEAINKFYVENLDLLGGRYGIATNNVSAKDVASVQVLENHQPVKALDSIKTSSKAAINLKLKDSAKGTLSIMAQMGLGASPPLWDNELTGMYFAKTKQHISTYKGNNSGKNLADELRSFTSRDYFEANNLLNIQMPVAPDINQRRYLFNNSNVGTVNNLLKTGEYSQLNFNLTYLNDHENREGESQILFYLPNDNIHIIDENMQVSRNTDRVETELRYSRNNPNDYLNNYLYFQGEWTNNLGEVMAGQTIRQRIKKPELSISNHFNKVKKRGEGNGFELSSSIGFRSTPQTLSIYPGLYDDFYNQGKPYSALRQEVQFNHFYQNGTLTLLSPWRIGKVYFDPTLSVNIENKTLRSNIFLAANPNSFSLLPADSLKNNLDWIKYTGRIAMEIRYRHENFELGLNFPTSYTGIQVNNQISEVKNNFSKLFFEPALYANYWLTPRIDLRLNYSFYNQLGDINSFYTGYIMQNYRTLNRYDNHLSELQGNGGSILFNYKDIINMFFAGGSLNYRNQKSNILYDQFFQDILIRTSAIEKVNSSENSSVSGRLSKGFYWMNLTTTMDVAWINYESELLRQTELVYYKNKGWNISGSLNMKPVSFLLVSYRSAGGENWSEIVSLEKFSPMRTFVNLISTDFLLPNDIRLNLNYEHYYNSSAIENKYMSFTDLSADYTWKRINFSLSWMNIFNVNNYVTSSVGDLTAYYNIYKIRPSNVLFKMQLKLN